MRSTGVRSPARKGSNAPSLCSARDARTSGATTDCSRACACVRHPISKRQHRQHRDRSDGDGGGSGGSGRAAVVGLSCFDSSAQFTSFSLHFYFTPLPFHFAFLLSFRKCVSRTSMRERAPSDSYRSQLAQGSECFLLDAVRCPLLFSSHDAHLSLFL